MICQELDFCQKIYQKAHCGELVLIVRIGLPFGKATYTLWQWDAKSHYIWVEAKVEKWSQILTFFPRWPCIILQDTKCQVPHCQHSGLTVMNEEVAFLMQL